MTTDVSRPSPTRMASARRGLPWARRAMAHLRLIARDPGLALRDDVRCIHVDGRWRWHHDWPHVPRADVECRHLAAVTGALEEASVPYFVVPATGGERPQVGIAPPHHERALRAIVSGLGAGWYVWDGSPEQSLNRARLDAAGSYQLYRRYRASGTTFRTGRELAVQVTAWVDTGGALEPATPTPRLPALSPDAAVPRRVESFGRTWPSVAALAHPHLDHVEPPDWLVRVPPRLRDQDAALADELGRDAARSVWFNTAPGTDVRVLDTGAGRWCDQRQVIERGPTGRDEVEILTEVWLAAPRTVVVLPAGGLVLHGLSADRLVTPGGLCLFDHDPERVGWRPGHLASERDRELHALQAWYAERSGVLMPWAVPALPVALPTLDRRLRPRLRELVAAADRPRSPSADVALTLLVWWAFDHGIAVPSPRGGDPGAPIPEGLDIADLLVDPASRPRWRALVERHLPVPAPWETRSVSTG